MKLLICFLFVGMVAAVFAEEETASDQVEDSGEQVAEEEDTPVIQNESSHVPAFDVQPPSAEHEFLSEEFSPPPPLPPPGPAGPPSSANPPRPAGPPSSANPPGPAGPPSSANPPRPSGPPSGANPQPHVRPSFGQMSVLLEPRVY